MPRPPHSLTAQASAGALLSNFLYKPVWLAFAARGGQVQGCARRDLAATLQTGQGAQGQEDPHPPPARPRYARVSSSPPRSRLSHLLLTTCLWPTEYAMQILAKGMPRPLPFGPAPTASGWHQTADWRGACVVCQAACTTSRRPTSTSANSTTPPSAARRRHASGSTRKCTHGPPTGVLRLIG